MCSLFHEVLCSLFKGFLNDFTSVFFFLKYVRGKVRLFTKKEGKN